jgi:hypothetical protein
VRDEPLSENQARVAYAVPEQQLENPESPAVGGAS